MVELSNDLLTVSLHPKGAEIISIKGKKDQLNYMWRRDASQWANSAPILFPIVGALKNDTCVINGIPRPALPAPRRPGQNWGWRWCPASRCPAVSGTTKSIYWDFSWTLIRPPFRLR